MNDEKKINSISKFLSMILRHKPDEIGLELDNNGWADIADLISKSTAHGVVFDRETLMKVVDTNNKQRFAIDTVNDRIRANQGHSVEIELDLPAQQPPEFLYHGTAQTNVESILNDGINKGQRNHVHLSTDMETAIRVGQRHGTPVVLKVQSRRMHDNGMKFFLSENGVWLTEYVSPEFIIK